MAFTGPFQPKLSMILKENNADIILFWQQGNLKKV